MPRKRGRARDEDEEDELVDVINVESQDSQPVSKKHKKHKKKHGSESSGKKHGSRHRSVREDSTAEEDCPEPGSLKPPIKLKIRIGSETFGGNRSDVSYPAAQDRSSLQASLKPDINREEEDEEPVDVVAEAPTLHDDDEEEDVGEVEDYEQDDDGQQQEIYEDEDDEDDDDGKHVGSSRRSDDSTSEDEKQWLDALESGNLEDYERKKQEKDPSLLTARQRALIGGATEIELLELPSGYKTTEMTEEQQQRRKQRALKRRMQAHEKKEKAKKQTMDRLLKKQQETSKRTKKKGPKTVQKPYIRYINGTSSCSISIPIGTELPMVARPPRPPPAPVAQCAVKGCKNLKKYSCSKTGVPLCSLECYKKNLALGSRTVKMHISAALT